MLRTRARAAPTHHGSIEAQFRNATQRAQRINSLEQHVPADLSKKPLAEVTPGELIDAMADPEHKVPETGRRIRRARVWCVLRR
jgi:hypothetical protein